MDSSHGQLPIRLFELKNDRCFQLTGSTEYDVLLIPSNRNDRRVSDVNSGKVINGWEWKNDKGK